MSPTLIPSILADWISRIPSIYSEPSVSIVVTGNAWTPCTMFTRLFTSGIVIIDTLRQSHSINSSSLLFLSRMFDRHGHSLGWTNAGGRSTKKVHVFMANSPWFRNGLNRRMVVSSIAFTMRACVSGLVGTCPASTSRSKLAGSWLESARCRAISRSASKKIIELAIIVEASTTPIITAESSRQWARVLLPMSWKELLIIMN